MASTPSTRTPSAGEVRRKIARFHAQLERRDHFEVLGVDRSADDATIKSCYHKLAKQWHADAYAGLALGPAKQTLDEIFQRITEAYETVTDPAKREEYLVYLERSKKGLVTDVNQVLNAENLVDDAVALMRRKDWAPAISKLEEALRLNPEDPFYSVNLGWARYNAHQKDPTAIKEAVGLLKQATKKQKNMPIAYQYLGKIYFSTGKPEEARRWWKQCLEYDRKNIEALRGIRLIETRKQKSGQGVGAFFKKVFGRK